MDVSVGIVIVTYGERWNHLQTVLMSLFTDPNIKSIVVVDNASVYDINQKIYSLDKTKKTKVINMGYNSGSALGVKTGVKYIVENSLGDFIWILDDDNLPMEDALTELLSQNNKLKGYSKDSLALVSYRSSRPQYKKIVREGNSKNAFQKYNSFLGIDFISFIPKVIKRINRKFKTHTEKEKSKEKIEVPVAPYGGMFFHKDLIDKIGYPNEEYYLYTDDHEFIFRLTKMGGKIFLIPGSVVKDIETSWNNKPSKHLFDSYLNNESKFQIYYTIRNRVNFDRYNLVTNKVVYKVNKVLFISLLYIFSLIYGKQERMLLILMSINEGEKNKLGYRKEFS